MRDHLVSILAVAAVALTVYCGSFGNGFVYDDFPFLVDNPAVRVFTPQSVLTNFTDWRTIAGDPSLAKDVWRPLVATSFALDYRLWKLDSRLYHVENAIFHSLAAILVYLAAFLVLESGFGAFIAAVVFTIHPVQTEAVAWVSGRANMLFLIFFLAAFIAHVLERKGKALPLTYGIMALSFSLALLSKEMAIVLPLVCILYDLYFTDARSVKAYVRYYLPLFLIAAVYLAARFSVLGAVAQKSAWWGGSFLATTAITVMSVAEYIRLCFFPAGLRVEYIFDLAALPWYAILMPVFVVGTAVAAWYMTRTRARRASFFIAWFFVTLIPVSNIVPFKALMAERFLYLPLIGFAALFGMLFAWSVRGAAAGPAAARGLLAIALSSAILAYGAMTVARIGEWQDELTFYMKGALRAPTSPRAHYNFAYACLKEAGRERGDPDRAKVYYAIAIAEYEKTVALKPDSQVAYASLGNAYNAVGRYDRAIVNLRTALALREESDVYNNLGVAYYHAGRTGLAQGAFRRALALDPYHVNAWINLGNTYYSKGERVKAKAAWLRAVSLGADPASVRDKLANVGKKEAGDVRP